MTDRFDNYSREALADLIGDLRSEKAQLEDQLETAKAEFLKRRLRRADGHRFAVTRWEQRQSHLDVAAIRATMPESWIRKFSKERTFLSVRVSKVRARHGRVTQLGPTG